MALQCSDMFYLLHIAILVGIYTILAVSANLIVGYSGLLSLAHAAFFGAGAYITALAALTLQPDLLVILPSAAILSGILGFLVGLPSLRVREDYFVITTFAFQIIIYSILNNWINLTGGPLGLAGIPQASILGMKVSSYSGFFILVWSLCIIVFLISHRIVQSPFGRVLKAIREDEVFALAVGKRVSTHKILIFVIAAGMAGAGGTLYAYYISFIDPTSFTVLESIFIVSIVIIGGAGNLWGSVLGAVVLVTLPELLRFLGLPTSVAANLRQILYGSILVLFLIWRPRGIIGEYTFQRTGGEGWRKTG